MTMSDWKNHNNRHPSILNPKALHFGIFVLRCSNGADNTIGDNSAFYNSDARFYPVVDILNFCIVLLGDFLQNRSFRFFEPKHM